MGRGSIAGGERHAYWIGDRQAPPSTFMTPCAQRLLICRSSGGFYIRRTLSNNSAVITYSGRTFLSTVLGTV
jgi:hypothetical protein